MFWDSIVEKYNGEWNKQDLLDFLALVRKMTKIVPKQRLSIQDALDDCWWDDIRDAK